MNGSADEQAKMAMGRTGEVYFACCECHELTYQCWQEHRCGLAMFGAIALRTGRGVEAVRRVMKPQIVLQRA